MFALLGIGAPAFASSSPTISGISNAQGMSSGASHIQRYRTISGTNFQPNATVTIGGVPAEVENPQSILPDSMVIYYPDHAPGTVNIVVTNPDNGVATSVGAFTYVNPTGTLYSVSGCCSSPISTINATQYVHNDSSGTGESAIIAITGVNSVGLSNNWISLSTVSPSANPNGSNSTQACQENNVWFCDVRPADTPASPVPGTIYKEIFVKTGTDSMNSKTPPGTYQMSMHVMDANQNFVDIPFTIVVTAATPPPPSGPDAATYISIPDLGSLTVGLPIANGGGGSGADVMGDGTDPTYSVTPDSHIPDLGLTLETGCGKCGNRWILNGTPTTSGTYSFSVTATVTGAIPSTYTQLFTGTITQQNSSVITFDGNGATGGSTSSQTANIRSFLTVNGFTRTGFTFNGWSTNAGGGGILYTDGAQYEFDASITLYAQWVNNAPISHTVTFNSNGGNGGSMSPQSSSGAAALKPNTFTKSGYVFDEWNTAPDGSGVIYDDQTNYSFIANVTLYVMWKVALVQFNSGGQGTGRPTHTVTYKGNGAISGVTLSQSSNIPAPLRANGFIRPGYVFNDWNSTTNHTGLELDAGDIYSFDSDITFYAEWSAEPLAAVTITASNTPAIKLASGEAKSLLLNIVGPTASAIPLMIYIPAGTVKSDAILKITPNLNANSLTVGALAIKIEILDVSGALVQQLPIPITIHFTTVLGQNIVAKSDDGYIWTPIPLITGTSLPAGISDGYYIDDAGGVVILSNQITQFGYRQYQLIDQKLTSTVSTLPANATLKLSTSGGSGEGAKTYATSTPSICKVSITGVVTGLKVGKCLVTSTKGGDAIYMHSTSLPLSLAITTALIDVPNTTSASKQIVINLGSSYSTQVAQVDLQVPGASSYSPYMQIALSNLGTASFKKILANGTFIRVRVGKKIVSIYKFSTNPL